MIINPILTRMLAEKAGCDVTTPRGAEYLRNDIQSVTGEPLSINTVKRIVGIIDYSGSHRHIIMDIIARYLGYSSWSLLASYLNDNISEFSGNRSVLQADTLAPGRKLEIDWDPDRKILLRHLSGKEFIVADSMNSKLQKGDILLLSQLAAGFPLYASDVIRNGESLGSYTAAGVSGIKSYKIY